MVHSYFSDRHMCSIALCASRLRHGLPRFEVLRAFAVGRVAGIRDMYLGLQPQNENGFLPEEP